VNIHLFDNMEKALQKNFDYLEKMDREREQSEMNAEDKPTEWTSVSVQIHVVPMENSMKIFISMARGKPIADEQGLLGLGARQTGIRKPIVLKTQTRKNGLGFVYNRYRRYPNRRYSDIHWVKGK